MLEKLGNVFKKVTDKLANAIFLDKTMVESIVKDLQRALIEADVNIHLVKELSDRIRTAAFDERIKGVEKKEHIIKLLHDYLLEIVGKEEELKLDKGKSQKIMLLGLYGSGKTTTINKLANYYSKRGYKTAMLGLDVHRPAATDQLEQLGKQNNLKVFVNKTEKNAVKIYKQFKEELKEYDLVFVDTAGRHSLDKDLIEEITKLGKEISPSYTILVLPADIGQAAQSQVQEFQKACSINGVIITRMDSSAKGGGALTACHLTKAPVYFITAGEKVNDLEIFSPKGFVSRILGMGDLESLVEKVRSAMNPENENKLKKRLEEGKFTLDDLYDQLKEMQNMGPLGKIAEMIPGLGKAKIPDNILNTQEEKMKKWKFAIQSMTLEEKENPEIMEKQTSRLQRISKGSGVPTSDIRALIKQYKMLKEFMKTGEGMDMSSGMSEKQMQKLAKRFGRKMRL